MHIFTDSNTDISQKNGYAKSERGFPMELMFDAKILLKQFSSAAFIVENGSIVEVNEYATDLDIAVGQNLSDLLPKDASEYKSFTSGLLCMTLKWNGIAYDASVIRLSDCDIVYLESTSATPELTVLASAARVLRDPLATAMLAAKELQSSNESDPNLHSLNRSLYRLYRDISNMSDSGSIGKVRSTKMITCNLNSVLGEITEKASELLSVVGKSLRYEPPSASIQTIIDSEKLERAILNLISNAVKFGDQNTPITIRMEQRNNRVYISVVNNTESSFDAVYHAIFCAYLQEPNLRSIGGIGLGMTIARNVALSHGGTLLFDRPEEKKVRFTLSFPLRISRDGTLCSPLVYPVDYLGGYDHTMIELADILPAELFK